VWKIAFSPDSLCLAVEAGKTGIALVDVASRTEVKRMAGHTDEITSIAFHPGGMLLASGSRDQTVRIWDAATSQQVKQFDTHKKVLGSVAFSSDGRFFASGGYDGLLCLWEVDGWREVRILALGEGVAVKNIVFSPVNRLLYFIASHTVQTLDPESGEVNILIPNISVVTSFALSPDARLLATGHTEYKDYRIAVWDVATKREIWKK
jgi:WD40 repeat protein